MTEVLPTQALTLLAAGATDIGRKRKHNEDHIAVRDDLNLYIVADGAGGHNAGEIASALAVRSICNYVGATVRATWDKGEFDRLGIATGARRLSAAVHKANRDVIEISETHQAHSGMGSTVVCASFSPRSGLLHIAHVGDSRCYRLRDVHLEQLTQDHSLHTDVLETRPELDETWLDRLPKNVVTRALGVTEDLRVGVRSSSVVAGDRYLLCSDGLSGPVGAGQIASLLAERRSPADTVTALIEAANRAGGPDNIGVIVIDCAGGYDRALPASPSTPPPQDDELESDLDPELLILGIEEVDMEGGAHAGKGGLLAALGRLLGGRSDGE